MSRPLDAGTVREMIGKGAVIVDIRPFTDFDAGHAEGSISVEYSRRSYSPRLDMVLAPEVPVIVLGADDEQVEGIVRQLDEAGRKVAGTVTLESLKAAGWQISAFQEIDIHTMVSLFDSGAPVVDIREEIEWEFLGVINGTTRIPLDKVADSVEEIKGLMKPEHPLILLCSAGLRSSTAASILARQGLAIERMCHPPEGLNGWLRAGLPLMRLEGRESDG